jgi:hypothetical protein
MPDTATTPAANAGIDMTALATMIAKAQADAVAPLAAQVTELANIAKAATDAAAENARIVTELAAQIKKGQEDEAERVAKAEAEQALGGLPGDRDAFASIFKSLNVEQRAALKSTLSGAAALAEAGAFRSHGIHKAVAGSAEAQLEAAAVEIRKADPKLSEAQAMEKAIDQNRELYAKVAHATPGLTA